MNDVTKYNLHEKMQDIFDVLENDHGILARANFSCCMGCATCELGHELEESDDHWGGVYYHKQNAEGLEKHGTCYVGFFTEDGNGTADLAAKACEIFKNQGLEVEWEGDAGQKIKVTVPGYKRPTYNL